MSLIILEPNPVQRGYAQNFFNNISLPYTLLKNRLEIDTFWKNFKQNKLNSIDGVFVDLWLEHMPDIPQQLSLDDFPGLQLAEELYTAKIPVVIPLDGNIESRQYSIIPQSQIPIISAIGSSHDWGPRVRPKNWKLAYEIIKGEK